MCMGMGVWSCICLIKEVQAQLSAVELVGPSTLEVATWPRTAAKRHEHAQRKEHARTSSTSKCLVVTLAHRRSSSFEGDDPLRYARDRATTVPIKKCKKIKHMQIWNTKADALRLKGCILISKMCRYDEVQKRMNAFSYSDLNMRHAVQRETIAF